MATSVELPRLGLRGPAALVAEWYLPDGASVHRGEPICRVEAENVAVEVEADEDGVLRHRYGAGRARAAGDVIGVILAAGERMPDLPDDEDAIIEERPAEARWEPDDEEWERSVRAFRYWPAEESHAVVERPVPSETAPEPVPHEAVVDEQSAMAPAVAAELDGLATTELENGVFGAVEPAEPQLAPPRRFEVLPFPRRTGSSRPPSWDSVPGDSVDFASDLFDRPEETGGAPFASDPVADAALDEALGLDGDDAEVSDGPGWEEAADEQADSPIQELRTPELRAVPHAAMMRVRIDLTEATKLQEQLGREWRAIGLEPAFEDVVVRATGRALAEGGFDDTVALRWFQDGREQVAWLPEAATLSFRAAVERLRQGDHLTAAPGCVLSTFAGVDEAVPALTPAVPFAIGVGDAVPEGEWNGEGQWNRTCAVLTLVFDAASVNEFHAARLLGRIRDLVEAPYALLAA